MRLRRIAVWSVLALLVSTVVTATWLWTTDLGFAKPHIERWVSEKTGREFAIDGPLSINLSRQTIVVAENIRFSNAEWADVPQMATVDRAELRIDLRSILDGPVIIDLIDVDGVSLDLVARADRDPNWKLDLESREKPESDDDNGDAFGLLIRQIQIDDVQAVLRSPDRDGPLELDLESFEQNHRSDDFLEVGAKATLNDRRIAIEGEAGTWAALLKGRNIQYAIEANIDTFELRSEGQIDDIANPSRPSLTFAAKGPDIDHLTKMLNIGDDGEGDIDLSGSLVPGDGGSLVLSIAGNFGQATIDASGAFSDLRDLDYLDVSALVSGPDLGRLLKFAGIKLSEKSPFRIALDAERQGPIIIIKHAELSFGEAELDGSARIPKFPSLDDSRISLTFLGPRIERFRDATGMPGAATGPFSLSFDVDVLDNGVEVLDLNLQTSLGTLRAQGLVENAEKFVGSELSVDIDILSLERVSEAYRIRTLPDRPLLVKGKVALTEDGIRTIEPLRAQTEAVDVLITGLVKNQGGLLGSDLNFEVSGERLSELTHLFHDIDVVPNANFELDGQLQIRNDGYRFRDATGFVGSSEITAEGLLTRKRSAGGSRLQFSIAGPKIEELLENAPTDKVAPGPFALSGEIEFDKERIDFKNIELERDNGEIDLDLELGLPISRNWANFDVYARGRDIRSLIDKISVVEFDERSFSAVARGELRGDVAKIDELRVSMGEASAEASGELVLGEAAKRTSFQINANIPSMAEIGLINGRRLREESISLVAEVKGREGRLQVEDFEVMMGGSDIRGNVTFEVAEVPKLDVEVFSDSIVFAPLLEESNEEVIAQVNLDDGRLIPNLDIPFAALQKLDGSLSIKVGELWRDHLYFRDIDLQVLLQDGVLDLKNFVFRGRDGYSQSRGRIDSENGVGRVSLEMVSRKLELGLAGLDTAETAKFGVELSAQASGNDVRELLGSLDGIVYFDVRGGRSRQSGILSAIYGDMLNEIFRAINPFFKSDPFTRYECIIAPVVITDGKLTTEPNIFVRTDKISIVAKPQIDLKTERLDVGVRTTPRKGIVISAGEIFNPFIKVKGKLSKPYLAVDEQGVLISGGAAVATGGLSIVAKGIWDRVMRSKDPCGVAANTVNKTLSDQFPDFAELPDIPAANSSLN